MNRLAASLAVFAMASGCDTVFGVHGAADGGSAIDSPVDAAVNLPCSPLTVLADDFTQNNLKRSWPGSYVANGDLDSIEVFGGRALFTVKSENGYAILNTPFYYDFRGQMLSFQFQDNGGTASDLGALFHATLESAYVSPQGHRHALIITRYQTTLVAEATNDMGFNQVIGTKTYNPDTDVFAQIGMRDGLAVFETSVDGHQWVSQGEVAYDHMDFVHPTMDARHTTGEWQMAIDNLMGGTPVGTVCDIDTLKDTFDQATLDPRWAPSSLTGAVGVSIDGGQLHIHTGDATSPVPEYNLRAATPYDFREGALFFEVPQLFAPSTDKAMQLVIEGFDHNIIMQTSNNVMSITYYAGAGPISVYNQSYDPMDKWWKVEHTTNKTTFSLSRDGVTYHTLASTPAIDPFPAAQIYIRAYSPLNDNLRLDNFNTPP